ncbi:hypothetical protein AAFM46_06205 [Arthrobacter sp. TMP15]|uniref:hypothetical protein n=1 Tax=Arthrobacter sp. TMP15 TaxID=3140789 RepID=UPI0031B9C80E
MSQLAPRTTAVTVGNNARALNMPVATPDVGVTAPKPTSWKARAPLSLVASVPKRSRSSLVVILFLVVVAALTVVLVMSISVTKGQYELVGLKNQQSDLLKANQTMEQEIAAKQAPQELVSRAAALGMVPAGSTGQIDVRTKKVSGSPQPASPDTKGLVSIPPALIDKPVPAADTPPAVVPLSPGAITQKEQAAQKAAAKSEPAPVPATATPDLNGGTIPAPSQKDS